MFNNSQICKVCSIEKPIADFYFRKDNNTYRKSCKQCKNAQNAIYVNNNKQKMTEYRRRYAANNAERLKAYLAQYYINNKEHLNELSKKDYIENKNKYNELSKAYYHAKKSIKPKLTQEQLEARNNLNLIKKRLRQRVLNLLKIKNWDKTKSLYEYIGCSQEQLVSHIESQFEQGMSWSNRSEWHIDHIMPLSTAKTVDELYVLCFYLNLKPIWAVDNLTKHTKITPEAVDILNKIKENRGTL